jgi:N-methylhydantoinase B
LWVNDAPAEHGIYRRLTPGDRLRFALGGGGGYGDPFTRDPEAVLADVRAGTVSVEGARGDYGVALDAACLAVDIDATRALRAARGG